ncbi:MAG: hypothetical protein EOM00_14565 [Clostridia bacterium]|nr:hypothetical protein [Clostridia bacterium]
MTKLNKKIISMMFLVVFLLLLTGAFRLVIMNSENYLINVVCTLLVFTIYIGMLSVWSMSIWRRVIHAHIRGYLLGVTGLMLFWIFVRTLRDPHFNYIDPVHRWLWYCYYISLILIPLLSFFAALCLGKPEDWRLSRKYHLLFIPAAVLILGILTNDLHQLAFGFPLGIERGDSHYIHHILYYFAVLWIAGFFLALVWLLFKKSYIPHTKRWVWMPLAVIGIGLIYTILYSIDNSKTGFGFIEITAMLCTLTAGVWESCIQSGLLLSNTKYEGFFDESSLGAQIVDENGTVYYDSKFSKPIAPHIFAELKEVGFLELDQNTQLHASPIQGGYIIWCEDISRISLLIGELENTKTELMDDVELLKDELSVRQRRLRVDEQNRLYDLTVRQIMPQVEKIKQYLAVAPHVDEPEKYRLLWNINVLGAYIKRRANLILMTAGQEAVTVEDLVRCLKESFENLEPGGVVAALSIDTTYDITSEHAVLLYDFFEAVVESALLKLHSLSVRVSDRGKAFIMSIEIKSGMEQALLLDENWKKEELASFGGHILCKVKDEGVFSIAMHLPKGGGAR